MAGNPVYGSGLLDLKPQVSQQNLSGFQSGLGGAMAGIAKAAAAVFVAGFAAAVGAGIKGVGAFAELETGMNEVFTLLPGISKGAMDDMTGQVRDFSKEFAILPDEVVPSLYSAISAGVPKDNVFEFLATAQQAALGGVTELETAVDGISSVVNAYGTENVDAAEASDLMFTAVRLGKTTFDELSGSLFNVTPTAAALGVGFGDVTAALAAMTAQGVPTSVATTQLRQLFVELSKEGTVASDTFKEISGKTFSEFVTEGGNVAEALEIMQEGAADNDVALQDMFGSVEAGAAALSLTSGTGFTDALDEMGDSAGATEAAYEQMDQGLSRTWDRIKVAFNDAFLEIGEQLAPHVQAFSDWFADRLPGIIANVMDWFQDRFLPAVRATIDWVRTNVVPVIRDQVVPAFQAVVDIVRGVIDWWNNLSPASKKLLGSLALAAGGAIAAFKAAQMLVNGFKIVKGAFIAMKLLMATNPFLLLIAAVTALVIFIITNWDKIKAGIKKVWDWIKTATTKVKDWIVEKFQAAVNWLKGLPAKIRSAVAGAFDRVKELATGAKDWVKDRVDDIVNWFKEMPGRIGRAVSGLFNGLKSAFKDAVNWVIRKWNDFRLEIKLPSLLGGGTIGIDTPNIPLFHDGIDRVPGAPGQEMLAILEAGERVLSRAEVAAGGRGDVYVDVQTNADPWQVGAAMSWALKTAGV